MTLRSWLASGMKRVYPQTLPPRRQTRPRALEVARGERVHFQVCLRHADSNVAVHIPYALYTITAHAKAPKDWQTRVRRVGYVPVPHRNTGVPEDEVEGFAHLPGYAPDPLFETNELVLPPHETHAFWCTVQIPSNARPGDHTITVTLVPPRGFKRQTHQVRVRVYPLVLQPRKNFRVTNWFYNDALLDFHACSAFDKRYWQVLPNYFQNMVEHRQDTIYVPIFTPPLDGIKRPTQLLRVKKIAAHRYSFDWRDVRKYVRLAKRCGFTHFEWTHLFTQWGVEHAIRIYEEQGQSQKTLWSPKTGATSKTYRCFLEQFLPQFEKFLREEKLLGCSFFHVSDEPHGTEHLNNYRQARALLADLAPWMQVMDALTEIKFAKAKLTDMPVPSIKTALEFVAADIPSWCYYCCGPRGKYLNRLMDTPLAKIRMNGWLFYHWPFQGFLHWGYNYWCKRQSNIPLDPFTVSDGGGWPGWAYGDTFIVYPGADGPLDSIRWEIFAQSMDDYALLQTADIDPNAKFLHPLRSFEDFPKNEAWIQKARRKILRAGS